MFEFSNDNSRGIDTYIWFIVMFVFFVLIGFVFQFVQRQMSQTDLFVTSVLLGLPMWFLLNLLIATDDTGSSKIFVSFLASAPFLAVYVGGKVAQKLKSHT